MLRDFVQGQQYICANVLYCLPACQIGLYTDITLSDKERFTYKCKQNEQDNAVISRSI